MFHVFEWREMTFDNIIYHKSIMKDSPSVFFSYIKVAIVSILQGRALVRCIGLRKKL